MRKQWSLGKRTLNGMKGLIEVLVLLVASPFVMLIAGVTRKRAERVWVLAFVHLLFGAAVLTSSLLVLTTYRADRALRLFTDYSQIKVDVKGVSYSTIINRYAAREGLDPSLVAAIVKNESDFNPEAVSAEGARGLMQLMPGTWRELAPSSKCDGRHAPPAEGTDCIFAPEANIAAGTRYLRGLLDAFDGDVVLAVAAYNAGGGAVAKYGSAGARGGIPPYRETLTYTQRVAETWANWRHGVSLWQVLLIRALRRMTAWCIGLSLALWTVFFLWINRSLMRSL